jgi:uncharacterized protein YcfL
MMRAFFCFLSMLMIAGCGQFGAINVDPNQTTYVVPSTLLTNSLRSISGILGRTDELLYVQMWSETHNSNASRYGTVHFDFYPWYVGPLMDLEHIIQLNTGLETKSNASVSGSNENQIAVARILRAYIFHTMTDRWGPLPYREALKGRNIWKPVYDAQEAIYYDLIKELKEAVDQMTGPPVKGDFLLGGNMEHWKKFANSLRAIMAMRMSNIDPGRARVEFIAAVADGLITDQRDNVMYPYQADAQNQNPWFTLFMTGPNYAISKTLVDYMKPLDDPRLGKFADPAPFFGEVRGLVYGISSPGSIARGQYSMPNLISVRGQSTPLPIITSAQMNFLLAEAAFRGWWEGDARFFYEKAISESMKQWGVYTVAGFNAFMQKTPVAWNEKDGLLRIGYQKWVALYLQGIEAWSEWRRLGYPLLQPAPSPLNQDGKIPRRHGYPTAERDINTPNYAHALLHLRGPDELSTRLWWDH